MNTASRPAAPISVRWGSVLRLPWHGCRYRLSVQKLRKYRDYRAFGFVFGAKEYSIPSAGDMAASQSGMRRRQILPEHSVRHNPCLSELGLSRWEDPNAPPMLLHLSMLGLTSIPCVGFLRVTPV